MTHQIIKSPYFFGDCLQSLLYIPFKPYNTSFDNIINFVKEQPQVSLLGNKMISQAGSWLFGLEQTKQLRLWGNGLRCASVFLSSFRSLPSLVMAHSAFTVLTAAFAQFVLTSIFVSLSYLKSFQKPNLEVRGTKGKENAVDPLVSFIG